MKGRTSNHFLRSENKPGDWASGQETLTFHQAYEQAVCFAVATARHGIGPGKRVGVYCSNGVEYTLAILGCHLSGAAAVIREPDMPIGELVAVTRATKPHLVLLTDGAAGDATAAEFVAKMAELPGAEMRKVVPWWTHAIEKDDGCDTTAHALRRAPRACQAPRPNSPGGGQRARRPRSTWRLAPQRDRRVHAARAGAGDRGGDLHDERHDGEAEGRPCTRRAASRGCAG